MFVSIKITFGFNDVTHIFGGPLRTCVTSLKNNRVKYLTSNLRNLKACFYLFMVTSIKKNYVALRKSHLLADIQDIVFKKTYKYSVSEFNLSPIIPYTSIYKI